MTRLSLQPLLWLSLALVCCDKPDASDTRAGDHNRAPRATRSGERPRGNPADAQENPSATPPAAAVSDAVDAREMALAEAAWDSLETNPEITREAFLQLSSDSAEKIRLIQHFAMRLAEQDPDEALAWADTLDTEMETAAAKVQIALAMAEADPQRAAHLLAESGIAGREFDVAVVQVLQRWAAKSPADAAAWALLFPPGAAREAGLKIIVSCWAKTDVHPALAWMATIQDETLRQEATLGMEETLLQQPKDIREEWLDQIDSRSLAELQQQETRALKEIGNNVSE